MLCSRCWRRFIFPLDLYAGFAELAAYLIGHEGATCLVPSEAFTAPFVQFVGRFAKHLRGIRCPLDGILVAGCRANQ